VHRRNRKLQTKKGLKTDYTMYRYSRIVNKRKEKSKVLGKKFAVDEVVTCILHCTK